MHVLPQHRRPQSVGNDGAPEVQQHLSCVVHVGRHQQGDSWVTSHQSQLAVHQQLPALQQVYCRSILATFCCYCGRRRLLQLLVLHAGDDGDCEHRVYMLAEVLVSAVGPLRALRC